MSAIFGEVTNTANYHFYIRPHPSDMSKRENLLAPHAHLVPPMLEAIRHKSGLYSGVEFFRRLSSLMDIDPDALRRSWARWSAVKDEPDGRSGLARSDSLERIISAAIEIRWLDAADPECSLLIDALRQRRDKAQYDRRVAAERRAKRFGILLGKMIQAGANDPSHCMSWPIAMYQTIGKLIVHDLRPRLLGDEPRGDELLGGTLSKLVAEVRQAAQAPLAEFEAELLCLERAEQEAFTAMIKEFGPVHDSQPRLPGSRPPQRPRRLLGAAVRTTRAPPGK